MRVKFLIFLSAMLLGGTVVSANSSKNVEIPIKKITLYSSGVGYFEHKKELNSPSNIALPFETNALNDVLKSITIYDPNTNSPYISYPSEETLQRTLDSLSVNLSNNPSIVEILNSLRGAEVKIFTSQEITGKIIGANTKKIKKEGEIAEESTLSLLNKDKIQVVPIGEITSYSFTDQKVTDDFNRALELILSSKNSNIKNVNIHLSGDKKREVVLSYVIASPVWKATYRFDLSDKKPYLQGWAIVDNVGEMDWENVELSLVTGRPTSFIQNLYAPYYTNRPTIPLSIAGFAEAKIYESGFYTEEDQAEMVYGDYKNEVAAPQAYPAMAMKTQALAREKSYDSLGKYTPTNTKSAGDLFIFTSPKPITLQRQQSAMIPLVGTSFEAKKISVFDGSRASAFATNPSSGVRFKNSSGMKLPAGPITVYDGGTYAGDALLEFLPENENRIISYGDDLSISGIVSDSSSSFIDSATISKGVLIIKRKSVYDKTYTFKNNAKNTKNLVLEHPFIYNSNLTQPKKYSEKTGTAYRFDIELASNKETKFTVKEEVLHSESISISSLNNSTLVYYASDKNLPKNIQDSFKKAAALYEDVNSANIELTSLKNSLSSKLTEQERVRKNIDTVKSDSKEGKEYIKKLTELDDEIETINKKIDAASSKVQKAQKAYSDFIYSLDIK